MKMNKRGERRVFVFVGIVLVLLMFINLAYAYTGSPDIGGLGDVEKDVQKIESVVEKVEDLQDKKFDYLKEAWTEYIKDRKSLGSVHRFFEKIDIVFVVLFARNYEVSIELFFAIMLWFATWYGLASYLFFFKEGWQKLVGSLAGTIVIAQARLFNLVSAGLFKIVFYRQSFWWSLLSTIVIVLSIIGYGKINGMIGKWIELWNKMKEEEEQKRKVEQHESEWQAMTKKYDNTKS